MKTIQEIRDWCSERASMRIRLDYFAGPDDHYKMTFENGDTYEYHATGDAWKETVSIRINGTLANVTTYIFRGSGWQVA